MMARRAVRCLAASLVATLLALPAAHAGAYVVDVEPPLQEAAGSSCGGRIPTVDAVDVPAYVGRWFQVRGRCERGWVRSVGVGSRGVGLVVVPSAPRMRTWTEWTIGNRLIDDRSIDDRTIGQPTGQLID